MTNPPRRRRAPAEPKPLFESLVPSTLIALPCSLVSEVSARAALRGATVEENIADILRRSLAEPQPRPSGAESLTLDVERLLRDGELGKSGSS